MWNYYLENPFSDSELKSIKERIIDTVEMSFDDMVERCEFIALEELYNTHDFSTKNLKKKMSG